MNNRNKATALSAYLMAIGLVWLLASCGKKCQPPPQQTFTTITGTEWRLISTSNPRMSKDVNRFSFVTMTFKSEFEGEMIKVLNNKRYDTPIFTFVYNLQSDTGRTGMLRIQYSTVPADSNGDGTANPAAIPTPSAVSQPTDYTYSLKTGLTLTEAKTGYVYEFVPFVGIVDPDSTCTF